MLNHIASALTLICLLSGCTKKAFDLSQYDQQLLDTVFVTAPRDINVSKNNPYRTTTQRTIDLLHTNLELSFDWEAEAVIGEATLDLAPLFYPIEEVMLDAKGFDIHSISMNSKALEYDYDGLQVTIFLDRKYTKAETLTIAITYTAHPSATEQNSTAITSNKGLFFIDPKGIYPDKPTQIWTQGETEYNSKWFPTVDKPNERCSQEVYVTVPDTLVTLSNGKLISSKTLENGMRQDYWKQELPHAPYLFMLAIGDYAVVEEVKDDILYQYMVYPEYEPYAKEVFNHTPEMVQFFGEMLGYPYPWDKYSQVIASDYVSGAMENTSAVIFGEFVQNDGRTLVDEPNDKIVAHELFHHWFGDLVTCESWSNLTMNEGFANYGEYLWLEHKYGSYEAEKHRVEELQSYLTTVLTNGSHDLIDFHYGNKEDMFDVHSYNKGGLVLHMLRNKLGDAAFFAGLNLYLKDNAFSSVEAHDLRLAYEEITGLDLNPFFNQWYFASGQPMLDVEYEVLDQSIVIKVEQGQAITKDVPLFHFDVRPIIYYQDGSSDTLHWTIDKSVDSLVYNTSKEVGALVFDGTHDLLAGFEEAPQSQDWYATLLKYSTEYQDIKLGFDNVPELDQSTIAKYKIHPFHEFRMLALAHYPDYYSTSELEEILLTDKHFSVRKKALETLAFRSKDIALRNATVGMGDASYNVQSEAMYILYALNPSDLVGIIDSVLLTNPLPYLAVVSDIKSVNPSLEDLPFYRTYVNQAINQDVYYCLTDYIKLSKTASLQEAVTSLEHIRALSEASSDTYKTYFYQKAVDELKEHCIAKLKDYKGNEKDELLSRVQVP